MSKIDLLLKVMIENKASDLHLSPDNRPMLRIDGELHPASETFFTHENIKTLIYDLIDSEQRAAFEISQDFDFAYGVDSLNSRFRVNFFMDRKGVGAVFRVIPNRISSAEELGLPDVLTKQFCHYHKGLILVTGAGGSGKSTTLAAMIDYINHHRSDHILTIEDPIEFVHWSQKSLVNQRQVGKHTQSFSRALKAALREDPDIILVGEMRDLETIELAITAAETGHLVFGTLHSTSAPKTIDRLIDAFPTAAQAQIRAMLADSLKGVVAQQLLRKKEGGRQGVYEVLVCNSAVSNLLREGKTFQIPSIMQTGRKVGMITMDQAIEEKLKSGIIDAEEAYLKAFDKSRFAPFLQASRELPVT
ncbi:type IV pili twitching motility protein PilT [bacterium (Candidatus Blackallbacteria) CG17_big_fil_post_rev_8_21_14_2_50_48_46]|uniref:Type IV pili twitching motility protein PilT n=1 Tax=bacterium (Candidatus Blackallbacteria) CG17_big_fil_post_rev_8_21_14_2_50_48_46 TaxID=2014261 RepID=A0A2M7G4H9_9BACT|nr:MAG: type IV pili twitching motility protein PilT [bacterium (Candidatus Blackallbacteria) CG18_big_fil_WC_8_21_14_2_50_49_26]PIW16444.1 MAG: type IV pili twitching motility protein PilT [bacterium (Candidatus Blackallbacteria) CG17_big_fil_post_rev_8_21_14_2_50_48_46]PIW45952.1 MAG: type IV pili twitching motility protein PilT [bacterium (Candidatus Blackallbacteria) CG13_big_fil_rev_8_21_14_2_50_49_14]